MRKLVTTFLILVLGTAGLALAAELASPVDDDTVEGRAADAYALSLAETSDALRRDVEATAASLSSRLDEPETRIEALRGLELDARVAYDLARQAETRLPRDHPARAGLIDANHSTSRAASTLRSFAESPEERLIARVRTTLSRAERDVAAATAEVA